MSFKIVRVVIEGELPKGCGDCQFVNIYTPDKGTDWEECEVYYCNLTGEEVMDDARPDYGCPLVVFVTNQVPEVMSPNELPILNRRIANGDIDFD